MFSYSIYFFWLQIYTTIAANIETLWTSYVNFYAHEFYMHDCKDFIWADALTLQV